uniref:Uncharacterized protein n=1 Tax=Bicosoecida sp. CB-2014 TaxID=1486930 RepID=A0A7S1CP72_9STRA|mmetsp:Transcript_6420/g.22896  ORF Transcript_6420/g.22896 Transcript_6420/m.22896 type:complete len:460 (+) Transcript_6420:116-1495(+)
MAGRVRKTEAEMLRDKVAALPDGVLKAILTRYADPKAREEEMPASAKRKLEDKRRDSIDRLAVVPHASHVVSADGVDSVLDLGNCEIGSKGAAQLAELLYSPATQSLTALDLSSNKLTDLGCEFGGVGAICSALSKNTVLTALNLARNQIQHQGSAGIARMLKSNRCIKYLDLSRNMLRSEGAGIIARAIAPHSNRHSALVSLNLSQNNLTNFEDSATGGMAVAAALRGNRSLTVLDLSHNRLDSAAVCAIGFALQRNKVLIDLRLNDNAADAEAAGALALSLHENRTLTRLDLRDNRVLSDGAKLLAAAMAANPVLQYVALTGNHIAEEGRAAMGVVLRPDLPAVQEALARLDDVVVPEKRHAGFTTKERALEARARAAGLLAPREAAGAGEGEGKGGGEGGEGKGEEDGASVEGEGEDEVAAADLAAAIDLLPAEDVDLSAKEVVFTSPVTGQTCVI